MITVSTFYKFLSFPDYVAARSALRALLAAHGIKGTVLLADEGINGTLAGTREGLDAFYAWCAEGPIGPLVVKESEGVAAPFKRLKVKLKKELISLGRPADPRAGVGTALAPAEWNALIQRPETIVLDARNAYEVAHGTFRGAINPNTRNFKELPRFIEATLKDKNAPLATFCTGGIRCEKLTAYLRAEGYTNVYQLKGGILAYLKAVPANENVFEGSCFVFDERETVR